MQFAPFKPRDIVDKLFNPVEGKDNMFECLFCKCHYKNNLKHGYSNLMNHIKGHDWRTGMTNPDQHTLDQIIDTEFSNACSWLKWITAFNLPFSFVNQNITRENTHLKPIDRLQ